MSSQTVITITFVVYLLVLLGIAAVAWSRTSNLADYILGGRRLGSLVSALSAQASDMSGWLLMGLPGFAYAAGMQSIWIALGLFIGTYLNWRLIARRLRVQTEQLDNALTIPDFFEARFADASRVLRVLAVVLILIFFAIYVSSGLVAGGKLFETVFDIAYWKAVIAGTIAILVYTSLGGFLAVSWTDALQGTLMIAALIAVVLLAVGQVGGLGATTDTLRDANPELLNPWTTTDGSAVGAIAIVSGLGWGLGYFGQPHILARFMAIRSPEHVRRARWIAVTWVGVSLLAAVIVGLLGVAYFGADGDFDREKVFMRLTAALFHPVIAGICLAAILAAIMSTADSQLLAASSAVAEDVYKALLRPGAGQRELIWVGRGAVMALALGAYWLARDDEATVLGLVALAWAGFGAAFGPVVLLGVCWPRMSRGAALAGMIVGGATVLAWEALDQWTEPALFGLYEIVPGFALGALAIVLMSYLTPGNADASDPATA